MSATTTAARRLIERSACPLARVGAGDEAGLRETLTSGLGEARGSDRPVRAVAARLRF